jgi:Ca-activated chloride channel family protein
MEEIRDLCARLGSVLVFILATGIFVQWGGETDWRLAFTGSASAAEDPDTSDKTLSPYFFVKSDDPTLDQLPLKSTSVTAEIAGVIADVKVTQVYRNEGKRPIEAVYVFPASTRAAVYGMKMTIGDRTIIAWVQKREEARRNYEEAKQQGKSASLLEQQRPNVFQMNVANIMPGDEIRTELSYTELLTPVEGIYEYVYPTVVGPRYSNKPAASVPDSEKWVANPYLHQGEPPTSSFNIVTHVAAGLPLTSMVCPSHKVDIAYEDPARATVTLDPSEKTGGNRDFILKYRLAGDKIASGLMLYQGKDENFFLLMVQPPKHIALKEIPPREYIFVVDVSGSMHGFPLTISKQLLKNLIGNLRPTDMFNVLLFSGGSQLMADKSIPATAENIRRAIDVIDHQQGGGGTELLPALKRAFALPGKEGVSRTVVAVTDGYVDVETQTFELIRNQIGKSNFFAFGIGTSVNRYLMEGMARAGAGEPFVITKPDEAPKQAEKFRQYVQAPVLTGIKLDFGGFDAYDVEPAGVPDVFSERPVIVFGKWKGKPAGHIVLSGLSGEGKYEQRIEVAGTKPDEANSALRYLWSRARIAELGDYNQLRPNDDRIKAITDLALKYNLLSAYTSFVAIDNQVRNKDGSLTTVAQPLPLPRGVSDYAVGGGAPQSAVLFKSMGRSTLAGRPASPQMYPEEAAGKVNDALETEKGRQGVKKEPASAPGIGQLIVVGDLSESAVRKELESHLADIAKCSSETGRNITGEVVVKWTVDPSGKIKDVEIVSNRTGSKAIEKCLVDWLKKQVLPASSGKGETTITASVVFGPA